MLCTFCGTDNRPENKFCGMCGVRMERRKLERRVPFNNATRKCHSCDNLIEQGHRFCAMCGSHAERRIGDRREEWQRAKAIANAQLPGPEGPPVAVSEPGVVESNQPPREPQARVKHQPAVARAPRGRSAAISGPSFLGLSEESESADYLLQDERSSGGVLRKLVLIAILAAIVGTAYQQWKAGFPILRAISRTAEPAKSEPAASANAPAENPSLDNMTSDPAKSTTATPDLSKPANHPSSPPDAAAQLKSQSGDVAPTQRPPASAVVAPKGGAGVGGPAPAAKAVPTVDPNSPSQLLQRGQQYLQGAGGVEQNCEQAVVYLKAAARDEAAAAEQMGTLYATGHCVPTDRVQAYRWLNSAHELQPRNARIQTSMNQLWAVMTPQERQQVPR